MWSSCAATRRPASRAPSAKPSAPSRRSKRRSAMTDPYDRPSRMLPAFPRDPAPVSEALVLQHEIADTRTHLAADIALSRTVVKERASLIGFLRAYPRFTRGLLITAGVASAALIARAVAKSYARRRRTVTVA